MQLQRLQIPGSAGIFFHFLWSIVLGAVQFHHKLCPVSVEIHNVITDYILPAKLAGAAPQERIPEEILLFGHVLAKCLGVGFAVWPAFYGMAP